MKLIAGLGNTGSAYQLTRHNIGFMVLDALGEKEHWTDKKQHFSKIQKIKISGETVCLAKPETMMNLSGKAIYTLLNFYKTTPENLLVIHDDVDLDFLSMKFQKGRGHGGHNGVKNIHELLGRNDYYRLKLGVGKSEKQNTPSHVLSAFHKNELPQLEKFLSRAVQAVIHFIEKGGISAGNTYNQNP